MLRLLRAQRHHPAGPESASQTLSCFLGFQGAHDTGRPLETHPPACTSNQQWRQTMTRQSTDWYVCVLVSVGFNETLTWWVVLTQ